MDEEAGDSQLFGISGDVFICVNGEDCDDAKLGEFEAELDLSSSEMVDGSDLQLQSSINGSCLKLLRILGVAFVITAVIIVSLFFIIKNKHYSPTNSPNTVVLTGEIINISPLVYPAEVIFSLKEMGMVANGSASNSFYPLDSVYLTLESSEFNPSYGNLTAVFTLLEKENGNFLDADYPYEVNSTNLRFNVLTPTVAQFQLGMFQPGKWRVFVDLLFADGGNKKVIEQVLYCTNRNQNATIYGAFLARASEPLIAQLTQAIAPLCANDRTENVLNCSVDDILSNQNYSSLVDFSSSSNLTRASTFANFYGILQYLVALQTVESESWVDDDGLWTTTASQLPAINAYSSKQLQETCDLQKFKVSVRSLLKYVAWALALEYISVGASATLNAPLVGAALVSYMILVRGTMGVLRELRTYSSCQVDRALSHLAIVIANFGNTQRRHLMQTQLVCDANNHLVIPIDFVSYSLSADGGMSQYFPDLVKVASSTWLEARPLFVRFDYVPGVSVVIGLVDALFDNGASTTVILQDSDIVSIMSSLGNVCSSTGSSSVYCWCSSSEDYRNAVKGTALGESVPLTLSVTYSPAAGLPTRTKTAELTLPGYVAPTMAPTAGPTLYPPTATPSDAPTYAPINPPTQAPTKPAPNCFSGTGTIYPGPSGMCTVYLTNSPSCKLGPYCCAYASDGYSEAKTFPCDQVDATGSAGCLGMNYQSCIEGATPCCYGGYYSWGCMCYIAP